MWLLLTPGGLHSAAPRVSSVLHSPSLLISLRWVTYAPSIKCAPPTPSFSNIDFQTSQSSLVNIKLVYLGALRSEVLLGMFFSGNTGHSLWPKCHLLSEIPAAFLPTLQPLPLTLSTLLPQFTFCFIFGFISYNIYLCSTSLVSASNILRYLALLPD